MLDRHVFRYGVAAPRPAAERERRHELEVVNVPDTALRRGGVQKYAAGLHRRAELGNLFLFRALVGVDNGRVPVSAVGDKPLRFFERVVEILRLVHGEHGRQLFVRKRLADIDRRNLAYEYARALGHFEPAKLRDFGRALSDDFGVDRAVDEYRRAHLIGLLGIEEIRAAVQHFLLDRVVHVRHYYNGLLGRANNSVVERLAVNDRRRGELDIRRRVDNYGRVARADADSRLARAVRRLDHARTARGEYEVALAHDRAAERHARHVNPADNVLGRARCDSRVEHDFSRGDCAVLCARVRGYYKPVARFERKQRFEYCRGRGVCRGHDSGDNADGLSQNLDAVRVVATDNVARLDVAVCVINILGGILVLYDLIFDYAHARFGNRHFGKVEPVLVSRGSRRQKNLVHLFLRIRRKQALCRAYARYEFAKRFLVLNNQSVHNTSRIYARRYSDGTADGR